MGSNSYVGAIEGFKSQIKSIQRASLFDVSILNFQYGGGSNSNLGKTLQFAVKSAIFPGATLGDLTVNYMGRVVHWYGDRSYTGQWATTCILDGEWKIFDAIYRWNQGMGGANRVVSEDLNVHDNFKCDAYVTAYSTDGQPAHKVMLHGLWPMELAEMTLDWSTPDTALDMQVTWVYDYVTTEDLYAEETRGSLTSKASTLEGVGAGQGAASGKIAEAVGGVMQQMF